MWKGHDSGGLRGLLCRGPLSLLAWQHPSQGCTESRLRSPVQVVGSVPRNDGDRHVIDFVVLELQDKRAGGQGSGEHPGVTCIILGESSRPTRGEDKEGSAGQGSYAIPEEQGFPLQPSPRRRITLLVRSWPPSHHGHLQQLLYPKLAAIL